MRERARLTEWMDDPACDEAMLLRTIGQFRLLNRVVARYRRILRRTVLADMQQQPARDYHLVDLGAGGCDIPVWLLTAAARRGLRLRVTALENDPRIVAWVRDRLPDQTGLVIRQLNAFDLREVPAVDFVFANHFLHHLEDASIISLLRLASAHAARGLVFSDLLRSRINHLAFTVAAAPLIPGSFAWSDGRTSIRRAFRPAELLELARRAELADARVQRLLPGRLLLTASGREQRAAA